MCFCFCFFCCYFFLHFCCDLSYDCIAVSEYRYGDGREREEDLKHEMGCIVGGMD